jgi:hypothetical protein
MRSSLEGVEMPVMSEDKFVRYWLQKVQEAALPFEANWTWRKLGVEDRKLSRMLWLQRSAFDEAIVTKNRREIAAIGEATVRGYAAAVTLMTERQAKIERVSVAKLGPNLQELVAKHGGYDKITEPAWEQFEREKIVWRGKLINGEFDREDDPSQQEEALR